MTDDTLAALPRRGVLALGLGLGMTALTAAQAHAITVRYYEYKEQNEQSWCSAASSRIALTARGHYPTQRALADDLGLVGGNGLQDPYAIARVLNDRLGLAGQAQRYYFRMPAAGTLKAQLRARVERSIDAGYPVVINMDRVNDDYFAPGHYIAIVGYDASRYKIADPFTSSRNGVWRGEDNIVAWNKLNRFTAFGA